ncbi:MAG: hypothetical protein DRZ80_05325 [Thermoprotei archaeon]|nr:MAG: hypothetical protein DRZ80_05325 [Thermoprotei archaeon]
MAKLTMTAEPGSTLMIEGKAVVEVVKGKVDVFGCELSEGSVFNIDVCKALPLYVVENAVVNVESGKVWLIDRKTIPDEWLHAVEKISNLDKTVKVAVIGGIDVGKSGFITFLTNHLVERGSRVHIIDADVGQNDIGPPTTIALGVTDYKITSLSDVPMYDAVFVGAISPHGIIQRCVSAVTILKNLALKNNAEFLILNTTGWVSDPGGRELKLSKISAFNPDVVVGIGERGELEHLLKYFEKFYEVIRLPPAAYVKKRSRSERKIIRKSNYARWFENAKEIELSIGNIASAHSFIFSGSKLSIDEIKLFSKYINTKILYGEICPEVYLFVIEGWEKPRVEKILDKKILFLTSDVFNNLLVGIRSKEKLFEGLGIITSIDFNEWKIKILTPVVREKITNIQFGYVKVNPKTFEEEKLVDKWCF